LAVVLAAARFGAKVAGKSKLQNAEEAPCRSST
jgi:hypothetical protein